MITRGSCSHTTLIPPLEACSLSIITQKLAKKYELATMRLILLLLALLMMAKHHHYESTKSTYNPRSAWSSGTTLTAAPVETIFTVATVFSTGQLHTRDGGDVRTFKPSFRTYRGRTRTVHDATTTTLPITETFTASPSPLITTEAVTVTETAIPPISSSSFITTTRTRLQVATSSPMPNPPVDRCYETSGGLQANGTVTSGCGGLLAHVQTCYNAYEPGSDPVNSNQNYIFQSCVCDTEKAKPFTSGSLLYRNYTGCAACLLSLGQSNSGDIYTGAQNLWNFCRSQTPFPYLFFSKLNHALQVQVGGPFIPSPILTLPFRNAVSTTPPLANLAYGTSAPPDGSLAKVTPSMITYTTSATTANWDAESTVVPTTITSLAAWVPTQAGKAWNAASASRSEIVAVSSRLASDICKESQLGVCPENNGLTMRPWWSNLLLCAILAVITQL